MNESEIVIELGVSKFFKFKILPWMDVIIRPITAHYDFNYN